MPDQVSGRRVRRAGPSASVRTSPDPVDPAAGDARRRTLVVRHPVVYRWSTVAGGAGRGCRGGPAP